MASTTAEQEDLPRINLQFQGKRKGGSSSSAVVGNSSLVPLTHAFNFLIFDHMPTFEGTPKDHSPLMDKESLKAIRKDVWSVGNTLHLAQTMYYRGELQACLDVLWTISSNMTALCPRIKKNQFILIKEMVKLTVYVIRRSVFLAPEGKDDDYFSKPCPVKADPTLWEEYPDEQGAAPRPSVTDFFERIWKELKKFSDADGGPQIGNELSKAAIASAKAVTVEASHSSWLVKEDEMANMYIQLHMTVLSNPWDPDVLGRVRGLRAMMGNTMETDLREYFCISDESVLQDFEADMECQYQEFEGKDLLEYRIQMFKTALQLCYDQGRKDQAQRYVDLASKNFPKALEKADIASLWSKIKSSVDEATAQQVVGGGSSSTTTTTTNGSSSSPIKPSAEDEKRASDLKMEGNELMARIAEALANSDKLMAETQKTFQTIKGLGGKSKQVQDQQQKEFDERTRLALEATKKHVANWAEKAIKCYTKALETCNIQDPQLRAILFNNRAFAQTYIKEYSLGMFDALAAIAANPRFIKAYYRAAVCARSKKEYQYAIKVLRMGIVQEREQFPDLSKKDSKLEELMVEILKESEELNKVSLTAGHAGNDPNGHTTVHGEAYSTTRQKQQDHPASSKDKKASTTSSAPTSNSKLAPALNNIPPAPYPKSLRGHLQAISILDDPLGLDLPREDVNAEEHSKLMIRAAIALVIKRYFFDHGPEGYAAPDLEARIVRAKHALNQCKTMCGPTISKPQRKRLNKIVDQAMIHLPLAMSKGQKNKEEEEGEAQEKAMLWCQAYYQDCLFIPQQVIINALQIQCVESQSCLKVKKEKALAQEAQNKKDRKKLEDQAKALEKQKKVLADVQKREEEIENQLKEFLAAKNAAGGESLLDTDPTIIAKRNTLAEIRESNAAFEEEAAAAEKAADVEVARLQLETAEMKEKLKVVQAAHQAKVKALAAKKAELIELRAQEEAAAKKEKEEKEAALRKEKELREAALREEEERKAQEKEEARLKRLEGKQKATEVSALANKAAEPPAASQQQKKNKEASSSPADTTSSIKVNSLQELQAKLSSGKAKQETTGGHVDPRSLDTTKNTVTVSSSASPSSAPTSASGPRGVSPPSMAAPLGSLTPTTVIPPAASDSIWTVSATTDPEPAADFGGGGGFLVSSSNTNNHNSSNLPSSTTTNGGAKLNPTAKTFEPKFSPSMNAAPWLPPDNNNTVANTSSTNSSGIPLGGVAGTPIMTGGGPMLPPPGGFKQTSATPAAIGATFGGGNQTAGIPQPRSQQRGPAAHQQQQATGYMPTGSQSVNQQPSTTAPVGGISKIRFFVNGTVLSSVWDESMARGLMDEYPSVEFDVHKPRVGKKSTIMVIAPSKSLLRDVVAQLNFIVADALDLDDEIYRELPNGDAELVGSLSQGGDATGGSAPPPAANDPFTSSQTTLLPVGTGSSSASNTPSTAAPNPFSKPPPSSTSPTQAAVPSFASMWGTTTSGAGGTAANTTTATSSIWGDAPLTTGLGSSAPGGEKKAAADDLGGMLAFINE